MIQAYRTKFQHFSGCCLPAFLFLLAFSAAAADVVASNRLAVSVSAPNAAYASSVAGRKPVAAFATEHGVYELDATSGGVRFWQRALKGLELVRKNGGATFVPSTGTGAESRFQGVDPSGLGTRFSSAVGMAKHPSESRFAVVCGGEWIQAGKGARCPSVQVYGFEETAGASGLSSLGVSFAAAYTNAFHETTNVVRAVDSVEDASYVKYSIVTNSITTNYVHVIELLAGMYAFATNGVLPQNEDLLLDHDPGEDYVDGMAWPCYEPKISTNGEEIVHLFVTNYVTAYVPSADASYLSSATDVAFLGDAGMVVSISGAEGNGIQPGLVFFDAAAPEAEGKVVAVEGFEGPISGIDVDPDTGDLYAAVPKAAAVYRFTAPGGSAASWLSLPGGAVVKADGSGAVACAPAGGEEGSPSSGFGHLSSPRDVSVWSSSTGGKILLVADTANARVVGVGMDGKALFVAESGGTDALKNPAGVYGVPEEDAIVVADTEGRRVRVWSASNLGDFSSGPSAGDAVYSVVFTAVSPTNLSFRVTCESGTPAAGDTVSLHASSDLSSPQADWPLATGASQTSFPVGTDISATGGSFEYGPIDIPSGETAVFYSVHAP